MEIQFSSFWNGTKLSGQNGFPYEENIKNVRINAKVFGSSWHWKVSVVSSTSIQFAQYSNHEYFHLWQRINDFVSKLFAWFDQHPRIYSCSLHGLYYSHQWNFICDSDLEITQSVRIDWRYRKDCTGKWVQKKLYYTHSYTIELSSIVSIF